MPITVTSFARSNPTATFHVVRGNALEIEADVAVYGRAPEVRRDVERRGVTFLPLEKRASRFFRGPLHQRVQEGVVKTGGWRRVFAIDYRGRADRFNFEPPLIGIGTHPANLAWNLFALLMGYALSGGRGSHFLFLPISCRNPEVVGAATVAACYQFASSAARMYEPPPSLQFVFCDPDDPSPFLQSLRNEGERLEKLLRAAGLVGVSHYRQNPITENVGGKGDWEKMFARL